MYMYIKNYHSQSITVYTCVYMHMYMYMWYT
jgi:hypothetical protein